ncbi:MAG: hypothetical protein M3Z69_01595 [Bombilactobacillus mellis]|uniref:hypothetical protein n=1 Tax=Bombilactobacillus mellis TaxID=1218508 RepID=UPI000AB71269|nr:hypothetical protein [Bombilactobacillus mellis]MCT6856654.1 hypothetical protein [Bombilactobacillus mellis]
MSFNRTHLGFATIWAVLLLNIECLVILTYLNFYQQELQNYRQLEQIYTQKIISIDK